METREICSFLAGSLITMAGWFAYWRIASRERRRERLPEAIGEALRTLARLQPDEYGLDLRELAPGSTADRLTEWYVLKAAVQALLQDRDRERMDRIGQVGSQGFIEMRNLLVDLLATRPGRRFADDEAARESQSAPRG